MHFPPASCSVAHIIPNAFVNPKTRETDTSIIIMETEDVNTSTISTGTTTNNNHEEQQQVALSTNDDEKLFVASLSISTNSTTPGTATATTQEENNVSVPVLSSTNSTTTEHTTNSATGTKSTIEKNTDGTTEDSDQVITNPTAASVTSSSSTVPADTTTPSTANTNQNPSTPAILRGPHGGFRPDPAHMDPTTGLSMSTGAIRARQRRAKEREEKKERRRLERLKKTNEMDQTMTPSNNDNTKELLPTTTNTAATEEEKEMKEGDSATKLVFVGNGPNIIESENNYCTNPLAIRLITIQQQRRRQQQQQQKQHPNVRRKKRRRSMQCKGEENAKQKQPHPQSIPPNTLESSSSGPSSLIASKLPLSFPPEEAFRAISLYATLRTFSLQLRLSPFTPTSFLLGLSCPFMTKLIGEIHLALLRLLFLNIGRGPDFYRIGGTSTNHNNKSSSSRNVGIATTNPDNTLMGSDCLTYMDVGSWPLFYVDYVEATKNKFLELDRTEPKLEANEQSPILKHVTPIPADVGRTTPFSVTEKHYPWDGSATPVVDNVKKEEPLLTPAVEAAPTPKAVPTLEEMKVLLLDLVDKISRKADGYGFFSRPVDPIEDQCPDYFEVVDPIHEAMDLETIKRMVADAEITTLESLELYLNRIVMSSRKYNTDEENFVRKQTERFDSIAQSLVQKTKAILGYSAPETNDESSTRVAAATATSGTANVAKPSSSLASAFMRLRASHTPNNVDHNGTRRFLHLPSSTNPQSSLYSVDNQESDRRIDHADSLQPHNNIAPIKKQTSILSPRQYSSFPLKRKHRDISASDPVVKSGSQQKLDLAKGTKKRSFLEHALESVAAGNELLAYISNSSHSNREIYDDDHHHKNPDHTAVDESLETTKEDIDVELTTGTENSSEQQSGARRSNRTRIRTVGSKKEAGSAFDSLPHVQAARQMEDFNSHSLEGARFASCYGALHVKAKLDILQFLLDELLQVDQIEAELNRRSDITRCFQPLEYALLPSKDELEHLSNVDDCVLCNYPGDLVCCDGCPSSFHKRCCSYIDSSLNRQKLQNQSDDEEKWLCPECCVVDSSKLGNLLGGRKPSLYWWKKDDLERFLKIPHTSPSTEHMRSTPNPEISDFSILRDSLSLPTSSEYISNKEFLIVHGFVFQRPISRETEPMLLNQVQLFELLRALGPSICSEWPWCQIPVNPTELWHEQLKTPINETQTATRSIHCFKDCYLSSEASFNPTLYKNMYSKAPPTPAFLQHQPVPSHLYQAASPSELFVANYDHLVSSCVLAGVMEDENSHEHLTKVNLPVLSQVTCVTYNDPLTLENDKLLSVTDHLRPAKDYLISLERLMFRSCLLQESWGMNWNKCKDQRIASVFSYRGSNKREPNNTDSSSTLKSSTINVSWGLHLINAQTVADICRCAVLLIDAVETRAFHEDWNKIPHKGSSISLSDNDTANLRPNVELPENWTVQSVLLKRKWERSSDLREGRRLLLGENTAGSLHFVSSIGRKCRKRPKEKETERKFAQQSRCSSDHDSKRLDSSNITSTNTNTNSMPRRGRPSKSQLRGSMTKTKMVTEFRFKCVHCMKILPCGLSLNGPQHATRDFFSHIQGCPSCPESIKALIAFLRSQKGKSVDGPSFFKLLTERARKFLSSDETAIFNSSEAHVVDMHIQGAESPTPCVTFKEMKPEDFPSMEESDASKVLNPAGSVDEYSVNPDLNRGSEAILVAPEISVGENSFKQLFVLNTALPLNEPTKDTKETPIKVVGVQYAVTEEIGYSGGQRGNKTKLVADEDSLLHGALEQTESDETSIDQSNEHHVFNFSPTKYVLVNSTDSHLASKYLVALYKNFIPSSMVQVPFMDFRGVDVLNTDRYSASAPRMRGQRGVSDRFFVGCVYCGYIPSLGIKVGGPQHTTKDLYYHICDCKKCPENVKALIIKLRSMGLKSYDSAKFFKLQLSRLAQHVNSRTASQLQNEILSQVSQRVHDVDISLDLTSEQNIYNFDNSAYPLVKKEDESIGSLYFAALYKHYWPVGKNFSEKGENESEVSLVFSASQKCMVWKSIAKSQNNDSIAEMKADKDNLQEPIEEDFHPDEDIIVVVTEVADEGNFKKSKCMDTTPQGDVTVKKTIIGNKGEEPVINLEVQEKKELADDRIPKGDVIVGKTDQVVDEAGIDKSKCLPSPEIDITLGKTLLRNESEDRAANSKEIEAEEVNSVLVEKTGEENLCETRSDSPEFLKVTQKQVPDLEAVFLNGADTNVGIDTADEVARDQAVVQESDGCDENQEDMTEFDLDSRRKCGRAVRRSGRVHHLKSALQEKLGSYGEQSISAPDSVQPWVTNPAEEEAVQQLRNARIANLERLLAEPFEKEIFWPICGRLYIPPAGSLSPTIMRYLGRNAGSRVAPFMFYSDKLEVGKPSVRQRWRTNTMECETIEELHLQFQILEHHLNHTTISSCEQIAKRSSAKNSVQKIFCSHRDAATGMIEYFVVNSSKNRGCWLPEDAIDLQSFVVMKRDRIEQARKKIDSVAYYVTRKQGKIQERKKADAEVVCSEPRSENGSAAVTTFNERSAPNIDPKASKYHLDQATISDATASAVLEDHFVVKLRNVLRKHHADAHTLFERTLDADMQHEEIEKLRQYNKKSIDSVNASLQQIGSRMWMKEDVVVSKILEAEHLAKRKVEEKRSIAQANNRYAGNTAQNGQVLSDAELLFEEAYMQHQRETKHLLAVSAKAGLKSVPEDAMNAVRARSLRSMESANAALIEARSPKALKEGELVLKLKNAESVAVQWHISEGFLNHHSSANQHTLPANRVVQQYAYYPLRNSTFPADVHAASLRQQHQEKQNYQVLLNSNYHQMGHLNRSMPQSIPQHGDFQTYEAPSTFSSSSAAGQQTSAVQVYQRTHHHPQSFSHRSLQKSSGVHHLNLATNNVVNRIDRQSHAVPSHNVAQQQQQQQRHFQQMQLQQQGMIVGNVTMMQQHQPNSQQQYILMQNPSSVQHQQSEYTAPSYTGQKFSVSDDLWKS